MNSVNYIENVLAKHLSGSTGKRRLEINNPMILLFFEIPEGFVMGSVWTCRRRVWMEVLLNNYKDNI